MSYESVLEQVRSAALRSLRSPESITVVAVSKTKTVEEIMRIYEHGHRDFGENRAQELATKAPQLPDDIRWHFVGSLQTNKVRLVRSRTYLLHSMDRVNLATAWLKGHGLPPPVLVQVNTGDEPQKAGVSIEDTPALVDRLVELGVPVRGLMAIPPIPETQEASRPHFAVLRELRDSVAVAQPNVRELSMGMTDDFEVAIEEGASLIRVGRAIFGPRN